MKNKIINSTEVSRFKYEYCYEFGHKYEVIYLPNILTLKIYIYLLEKNITNKISVKTVYLTEKICIYYYLSFILNYHVVKKNNLEFFLPISF